MPPLLLRVAGLLPNRLAQFQRLAHGCIRQRIRKRYHALHRRREYDLLIPSEDRHGPRFAAIANAVPGPLVDCLIVSVYYHLPQLYGGDVLNGLFEGEVAAEEPGPWRLRFFVGGVIFWLVEGEAVIQTHL